MPLPTGLGDALSQVGAHPTVVVATDFDGVLAPIVDDPSTSRAVPGTIDSLREMAGRRGVHVAVVSGRDLATLSELSGIPTADAITLVGSHGAETTRAPAQDGLSPSEAAVLTRLQRQVRALRERAPGLRIEYKPTAVVVHTRGLTDERAEAATSGASALGRQPGVHLKKGKSVVELTVVRADKGSAVMDLAADVVADAVVYLGDDVTDEDVFARLGPRDVGIKVGQGDTAAGWRVDGPEDVATLLRHLADELSSRS